MEFSSYTYSKKDETTIEKPRILVLGKPEDDGAEIARNSKSFDIDVSDFKALVSGLKAYVSLFSAVQKLTTSPYRY